MDPEDHLWTWRTRHGPPEDPEDLEDHVWTPGGPGVDPRRTWRTNFLPNCDLNPELLVFPDDQSCYLGFDLGEIHRQSPSRI